MFHRDKLVLEVLKLVIFWVVLPEICQIRAIVRCIRSKHVNCVLIHRDHPHMTIPRVEEVVRDMMPAIVLINVPVSDLVIVPPLNHEPPLSILLLDDGGRVVIVGPGHIGDRGPAIGAWDINSRLRSAVGTIMASQNINFAINLVYYSLVSMDVDMEI